MARFITSFQQLMISAALPDEVVGYIQDPSAVMTLFCNDVDVLTTTVYAYNGYVRLYDIRSLIEGFIREEDDESVCVCQIKLIADQQEIYTRSFTVIYSEFNFQNVAYFFANHFATTRRSFRISREGYQYLWWYKDNSNVTEACFTECVIRPDDGSAPKVIRIDEGSNRYGGFRSAWVRPQDIQQQIDEDDELEKGRLLTFAIHRWDRSMTFYVTDEQPDLTISFYDGFYNAAIAELYAVTTRKLKVERNEATCQRSTLFYDQQEELSFEVETSFLPYDEAVWLEQMLSSRSVGVRLKGSNQTRRILITDSTSEISDSDNDKNKLKFSFKLATQEQYLLFGTDGQYFSDEYQSQFQ